MKRIFLAFIATLLICPVIAQPPARIREAKKNTPEAQTTTVAKTAKASGATKNIASKLAATKTPAKAVATADGTTKRPAATPQQAPRTAIPNANTSGIGRAQLEYPTAPTMPDDVSWRRDLYRVIDLSQDKNAVLYYPQEPDGDRMNLFTYLFKLVMRKQIIAYDYTIDGNENFKAANQLKPKDILERHHIRHQTKGEQFRIEDSDIPAADVRSYYVKESTYFDQHTSSFHTQVTAICPVREEADEFGGASARYPMFWLKYSDIAPFLAKLELMASNYNNAATISADDYFTTNKYEGKVYKTNNLQGRVIANSDSLMKKEQKRIEKELKTLESHVWGGDSLRKDSTDSVIVIKKGAKRAVKTTNKGKNESVSTSSRSQVKRQKESGGAAASRPRVSVRRARH